MKTIFHVVNSVKGGSGKSTFSLLLASYFIKKKKEQAYIIDLDLQGTSWEKNYNRYLKVMDGQKKVYLNDLMYDFANNITQDFIRYLKVSNKDETVHTKPEYWDIPVCVSNPDKRGIDEVELDLFENAIYKLINRIIEREVANKQEVVHIIFDMPPSKEKHSEKILNHLLLDKSSYLSKLYPYYVHLYMMSAISPAHIELNLSYVKSMIKDKSYSSTITSFIDDTEGDNHFHFSLILNDVTDVLNDSLGDIGKSIKQTLENSVKFTADDSSKLFKHTSVLKHLKLKHITQILSIYQTVEITDDELIIIDSTMSDFEDCFKSVM